MCSYIDGAKCTVITDHSPLEAPLDTKDLTGRLAEHQTVLQGYDIEIVYRLSREYTVEYLPCAQSSGPFHGRKEQDECGRIKNHKEALRKDSDVPRIKEYILMTDMLYRLPERIYQGPQGNLFCPKIGIEEPPYGPSSFSQLRHSASGREEDISSSNQINVWNDMPKNIRDYVTR
ncbi:unnamed protein product [Cylicostephanus goldi]|uniref:Reverse transcriptase RNase H-like domain-containing protein n=1 Tax=Cylicostephanus goldi TaxID=71465 RepID=A0A3P6T527_CYLGO|nr:unnamed protein product [Cylicostephanus goldi]